MVYNNFYNNHYLGDFMKLKQSVILFAVFLLITVAVTIGYAQEKYEDVKAVVNDFASAVDNLNTALDSWDGKQVAAALKEFESRMKEIEPQLEVLSEKYPELTEDEFPAELQDVQIRMKEAEQKMQGVVEKLIRYKDNEDVQKAMEEMGNS